MAKFVFDLESLLEQRRREERACMKAVGEIERDRLELERQAFGFERQSQEERDLLQTELGEGQRVDLTRVRLQANASLHAVRKTTELALRSAAVTHRLEGARERLREAAARRKAVELLRERRFEAWLREQRRVEDRDLDELTTSRYARPGDDDGVAA